MEETRRSFLKSSTVAAGSALGFGIVTQNAEARKTKTKSRLRGSYLNPIPATKVQQEKNRVVNSNGVIETSNTDTAPTIAVEDMPDDHNIVAFNFDIIDGAPSGWIGAVADPAKGHQRPASLAGVRQGRVANIHQKAKQNANVRDQRKQASAVETAQYVPAQSTQQWSNWDDKVTQRHEITDSNGNETGYDIRWKSDPSDFSNQGIETEIRLLPQETDFITADWQNRKADPSFSFNESLIDYVSNYGPGNSVGTVTNTISLTLSSDKTVEVGASQSNTSSNIDIDNDSNTFGGSNYVNQRFSISGDLKWNTVRVNQAATTVGTRYSKGVTYCDMKLKSKYRWGGCCKTSSPTYNFSVYWA